MDRNTYSLSHLSHRAFHIGRWQTLSILPMEPGSSIDLSIEGIMRLAAPRREIVSDCQFDICVFWVPHRIHQGQKWIDFINKGPTATPYTSDTTINVGADYRTAPYLCQNVIGATINPMIVMGYNSIFYNYLAIPSFSGNADNPAINNLDFDWFPTNETGAANCRLYGRLAARLPHILNGANVVDEGGSAGWEAQTLSDNDQKVPSDPGGDGYFNLTDLADIQGRYKSKVTGAWFTHFYQDVIQEKWGTHVGPDADPRNLRPTLLMRETTMLSGHDVDGTDDATLGSYQGKTLQSVGLRMPRKLFAEHGNVFILACPRYPLVHTDEVHYLLKKTSWAYNEIAGDPDMVGNQAPENWDPQPWLTITSTWAPADNFKHAYGQWYRFQNNVVHPHFKAIPGYPFSSFNGANAQQWFYYADDEYALTFETPQIGQGQLQALIKCDKHSLIPGVSSSYFAGTN